MTTMTNRLNPVLFGVCQIVVVFHLLQGALGSRSDANEASFYGESYVFTPVREASSSNSVSLQFRSHRPQGLLLLAAGQTDYVVVQLNAGIVETRVNLGSGEAVTFSARGVRLDDSRWHEVLVNRTLDTVYLAVDGIDAGQATTPGTYHDLNIDLGVLLGGTGNLKEEFYRGAKSFRGCLRSVFFNGHDILKEAKELKSAQNAFQVAWHCDDEFTASSNSPISLSSDTSFVAFPHLRIYPQSDGGVFSCEVKTRSPDAVILFNSGQGAAWEDFIAVELVDGRPKLSIDKGSGVIEVWLDYPVSDGKWHKLEVSVSETVAELQIDTEKNLTRFHLGGQNYLNLAGHVYLGGVGFKTRSHAIRLGLVSLLGKSAMKGSMVGCLRNIMMNSRTFGFHQIEVSRLIDPDCAWEFPCSQDPCLPGAQCTELEGTDFRCDCGEQVCVKDTFRSDFDDWNEDTRGIVSVSELKVVKGGVVVINQEVIQLNRALFSNGLTEEHVVFTVKDRPKSGSIEIKNSRGSHSANTFTLRELTSNSIVYRHYGGEEEIDSFTIELTFNSLLHRQEAKLKDKYEFVVPVRVQAPKSSNLEVVLSYGNIISVTPGAKIRITPAILNVPSSDIDSSKLRFVINYLRQARSMFERSDEPKISVTSFTLKDVQDGYIWFQHNGDRIVYTKVNVTDGVSVSESADFRFKEEELQVSIANNTGITLSYGSHRLITNFNLSAVTNAPLEDIELRYHITKPPAYGTLQRMEHQSSKWVDVETFSQRHLNSGRIRYLHLPSSKISNYDNFKFEVSAQDVKKESLGFQIQFKTVVLSVEHSSNLVLSKTSFGKFSNTSLSVISNAENLDFQKIVYMMLRPPQKGDLYLIPQDVTNPVIFSQVSPLKTDDNFTQQDVNNGHVYYKFNKPGFEKVNDFADLQAAYYGFIIMVRPRILYTPESSTSVQMVNNGLLGVPEGGSALITERDLSVKMDKFKRFTLSIINYPSHGHIEIVNPDTGKIERGNASFFTMSEISAKKVLYKHDDSENQSDFFTFSSSIVFDDSQSSLPDEIQEFSGTFHIAMKMINDNAPVRSVSKIFKVASGQSKVLSIKDLAFTDPDIDFDDSLLSYHRQPIPNGDIINAGTKVSVYNFTQSDLIKGNLIFQHKGNSYTRTPISVSDGQFITTSIFEIQASSPYVMAGNNTGVTVLQGKLALITPYNLSIETNMDFDEQDATFQLVQEPEHGQLRVSGRQVLRFSYRDVLRGLVRYWHDGTMEMDDKFTFTVSINSFKSPVTTFKITVEVEGVNEPPQIVHNGLLRVLAYQTKAISKDILQVSHKGYEPWEIEYIITRLPQYGHLIIGGKTVKQGEAPEFNQADINAGRVQYASESPSQLSDTMVFDVGTDVQSLRHIEFLIEIVPLTLPQNKANATVMEGGSIVLLMKTLALKGRLAQNREVRFTVERAPVHGRVVLRSGSRDTHVSKFSYSDISRGRVHYVHDGSESLSDEMAIKTEVPDASTVSQVTTLYLKVTSVDDQPPRIVVNTGLDVWTGSITLLTNEHLQASDSDSTSSQVEFRVTAPTNGHLAFLNNTFKHILRFTQRDIDSGQLVFVHKGNENGEFQFQATDGRNKDDYKIFRIRARPVQLSVMVNETVKAFPRTLELISNRTLLVKTSAENFSQPIVFTVVEPRPRKGRLVTVVGAQTLDINSFTQEEVNEGKVFFLPTSHPKDWSDGEGIYFEISTTYAQPLKKKMLQISISFSNLHQGNYRRVLKVIEPVVAEGEQVTISADLFNSSKMLESLNAYKEDIRVEFSFVASVHNGYLWFRDMTAEMGDTFTQEDLNKGSLVYKHDHSDTVYDWFQFGVMMLVPRSVSEATASMYQVFNFTVDIEPLNDAPFELLTRHPKIIVKQGSEVTLNSFNLSTVDLDTGPEGIVYIILTQPDNGMFVKKSQPLVRLTAFTQKDIDDGDIIFKHDGTRKASSSMYFKVWDTVFDPWFANMDIFVTALEIEVASDRMVPLIQGSRSVTLSSPHLKVTTNGDPDTLVYKVIQAPQFGKLRKSGVQVTDFTQLDLESGALVYTQNTDSPGEDFFVCNIALLNQDCHKDAVQFDIIMKPLVRQGPLLSSPGSHVAITRASLDASELAQITNDNPRFEISSPPEHGKIMKKNRMRKRSVDSQENFTPVSEFTFEDVLYTRVYYVASQGGAKQDSFKYKLTAAGVPPAEGELVIQLEPLDDKDQMETDISGQGEETPISPEHDSDDTGVSERGDDDEEKDSAGQGKVSGASVGSDDGNTNVIIIATVVSLLTILVVVVVLVILFLRRRKQKRSGSMEEEKQYKPRPYISGPLQLDQPHVLIEPKHDDTSLTPMSAEDAALVEPFEENTYMNTSLVSPQYSDRPTTSLGYRPGTPPGSPDVTQSDQASEDMERRSTMTSGRDSNASTDLMDWTLMDPDLLQHCRTTTPVLRSNQYWL
ncbi:chondroitin sulfate proteoglycan 4 [Aplysia californica]|uniref:Chondroitin sulfate proteoglycan 4 n=1 Tax=Aplysia californica TaxID=6500 RepID=A0ABM0JYM0_APLCA|nr:chondroitin sulfate proteoglycan 4 [Aplysia californica]